MERNAEKERRIAHVLAGLESDVGEIFYFDTVGSTMDAAFNLPPSAALNWALVLTDAQTSGRGRYDRKWYSTSEDLTFSLVLTDFDYECPYAMVAALAVYKAFGRYTDGVRLKWVNDLLWRDGRKLAGILVEERAGRTVIGIGVNLNTVTLPREVGMEATSLFLGIGRKVPKDEFFLAVMDELLPSLHCCSSGGTGRILAEYEELARLRGKRVKVSSGIDEYSGTVVGLNRETGALLLDVDGDRVELYDGSIIHYEMESP